jgi:hypothetical protein
MCWRLLGNCIRCEILLPEIGFQYCEAYKTCNVVEDYIEPLYLCDECEESMGMQKSYLSCRKLFFGSVK